LRLLVITIFFTFSLLQGCNNSKYITVKHVKPINRNRYYNPKKDRRKKKVKYVRVKILKKSAEVRPAKVRAPKKKKIKSDSLNTSTTDSVDDIEENTDEQDSTGLF